MGPEEFDRNVELALADAQLRRNFAFAMGSFIARRQAVFSDPDETERLRSLGQSLKRRVLSRLPELLEQLEENCTRNGIQVHWAETTAVANRIVLDIVNAHSATIRFFMQYSPEQTVASKLHGSLTASHL